MQLRRGDIQRLLLVAASLTEHPSELTSLAGFTLLVDAVKSRWSDMSAQQKAQVSEAAMRDVSTVCQIGGSWAIRSKVSLFLSSIIRQQGPEAYGQVLPQLLSNGRGSGPRTLSSEDALRDELSCLVLHFISEDLTHFDPILNQGVSESTDANRRAFLAALSSSVELVFPFLSACLEVHFLAASSCKDVDPSKSKLHMAVVSASLQALSAWVEWTPMARVSSSNVLDACGFFLSNQGVVDPDLKMLAVDVLRQVSGRKRTSEGHEEYDALMDKCASVLLSSCQHLGFITQDGSMVPSVSTAIDSDGPMEELGLRVCSTLVTLGENHFKCISSHGGEARRDAFLAQCLAFTRHPNLLISTLTLPLWSSLLRDALPNIQGGSTVSPAVAAAAASSSQSSPGQSLPGIRQASIHVPPECCKSLMNVVVEQMPRVLIVSTSQRPSEADEVTDWPPTFNTMQEWKEFASSQKGHLKQILRLATHLCPEQGLSIASESIRAAATAATTVSAKLATRRKMLETSAMVLESTVPPLADLSEHVPAASQGLESLMRQTIDFAPLSLDDLGSIPLLARAYESFARLIAIRRDLASHLISACLALMKQVPLEEHGQMPPPVPVTPQWKKAFEARLGAASAISNLAKSAPAAFVPHLGTLVAEVQSLWAQGLLREGERVLIWEALLSSAVAAGPEAQSQVLAHILAPMASQWGDAAWRQKIASPQAFAASFLTLTTSTTEATIGSMGQVSLGSRGERWTLYHQCTLLERAYRRSLTLPPSQEHPPGGSGPCSPHLGWSLPVVCQILFCLHGLWAPEMKQMLGPLQIVTEIDPRERAARLNEDIEAAKEEPRCVAGASLHDARYFIRGCRESCYMILSLVAQHCGASLWNDTCLQSILVPSLCSSLQLTGILDYSQLRLIHRHVLLPIATHCPPEMQPIWTLPIVKVVVPSMCDRLARDWSENLSSSGRLQLVSSTLGSQEGGGGGGASEEVLADALLREATREHMELLFQVTRKPGDPPPSSRVLPYSQKQPLSDSGVSRAGSPLFEGDKAQTLMDLIIRTDPMAAEAAMRTALMGLCWPDAESCAKAVSICKYFVNLASVSFPQLEPFICNDMLKTGIVSVSQVFTIDIQADVLGLLRLIIFTFLLNRKPSNFSDAGGRQVPNSVFIVRRSIAELLQLPEATIEEFEQQLTKTGSEKKQSAVLKQLIASSSSSEQVRKLLSFRLPSDPLTAAKQAEQTRKPLLTPSTDPSGDDLLGGAIFNLIFH